MEYNVGGDFTMVWLERKYDNWVERKDSRLVPVEHGTIRSFASRFHDPGSPQVEVLFIDDEKAKIYVPDITVKPDNAEEGQPVEKIIEKQSFILQYKKPASQEQEVFYEAEYREH